MNKRVTEIAKERGLPAKEVIDKLKAAGINVKAPSSSVDEAAALRALGNGGNTSPKGSQASAPARGSSTAGSPSASASSSAPPSGDQSASTPPAAAQSGDGARGQGRPEHKRPTRDS